MNRFFEKLILFIFLFFFIGLSYVILNIDQFEYDSGKKDYNNSFLLDTYSIPSWMKKNSKCSHFNILRKNNYFFAECLGTDNKKHFYKKYEEKNELLKDGYFYVYDSSNNNISIYFSDSVKNKDALETLRYLVDKDIAKFFGADYTDTYNYHIKSPEHRYILVKPKSFNNEFILINRDNINTNTK